MSKRILLCVLLAACSDSDLDEINGMDDEPNGPDEDTNDGGETPAPLLLENNGTSAFEGHTPRGFQGMGTGLFVGDNLNPSFPDGDGVQMFLTFDISGATNAPIESAVSYTHLTLPTICSV